MRYAVNQIKIAASWTNAWRDLSSVGLSVCRTNKGVGGVAVQRAFGFVAGAPEVVLSLPSRFRRRVADVAQRASGFESAANVFQRAWGFRRRVTDAAKKGWSRFRRSVTDVVQHSSRFITCATDVVKSA